MKNYIMPERIIISENAENTEEIFADKPLQADFCHDDCVKIMRGGYILLDFGCELRGGITICVQLTSKAPDCAKCRIVFGESVMEALSTIGEKNALNAHAVRDMVVDIPSMSTNTFGSTGFRFVKIEALDADINIKSVKAKSEIKELEYKGSFECDDELLNRIWQVGAYTVQLNMGEFIWDGVKRDRLVWIGDMHPEVSTVNAVFGADDSIERSLDFVKKGTPPDKWMNGIATYSIWWIIIQYDNFMHTGDIKYLSGQREYIEMLCRHIFEWIDDGMKINEFEGFVDWSSKDTESEEDGRKSVFCMGLDIASRIFKIFEDTVLEEKCRKYCTDLQNDKCSINVNKRVAALNILAGRNTDYETELLKGDSPEDLSCFMGYYILLAKAKLGQVDDTINIIKEYWGGMLKMGATTFWEDFDIKWMENSCRIDEITAEGKNDIHGDFGRYCYKQFRHSLCHGWASGPTAYLSQYVLGVRIAEPGCKKVIIQPHLGDLKWVKGKYPTPFGAITIEHKSQDGKVITKYSAPEEIEVIMK